MTNKEPKASREVVIDKTPSEIAQGIRYKLEDGFENTNGAWDRVEAAIKKAIKSERDVAVNDYRDMRRMQAEFMRVDHELRKLKAQPASALVSEKQELDSCLEKISAIFGENSLLLYKKVKVSTAKDLFPNIENYIVGWRDGCAFMRANTTKASEIKLEGK